MEWFKKPEKSAVIAVLFSGKWAGDYIVAP